MRWLLFLFFFSHLEDVHGQYRRYDAPALTDSLLHVHGNKVDSIFRHSKLWTTLYDSVLHKLSQDDVEYTIHHTGYTYPDLFLYPIGAFRAVTPTNTELLWLSNQYNINGNPSVGCIITQEEKLFDSLMNRAIEIKYGADIFTRAAKEADSLDKIGLGLALPFIVDSVETQKILNAGYGFIKEWKSPEWFPTHTFYLCFRFKNGAIDIVTVSGEATPKKLYKKLTQKAKKMNWTPPKFLGKPIDQAVNWNIKTCKLSFAGLYIVDH